MFLYFILLMYQGVSCLGITLKSGQLSMRKVNKNWEGVIRHIFIILHIGLCKMSRHTEIINLNYLDMDKLL